MNDTTRIWKGVLSYLYKFDKNLWALGEFGYLDENYFGGNLWGRYYIPQTNLWAGGRLSATKEREYDSFGGIPEYKRNYYYDYSKREYVTLYLQQNGDNGWNL